MALTSQRNRTSATIVLAPGVSFEVGLAPGAVPKLDELTRASNMCPDCKGLTPVREVRSCPHGHGPFSYEQLTRKGREIAKGTYAEVTAEQLEDLKLKDQHTTFQLNFVPVADLRAHTFPTDGFYRLRPAKHHAEVYSALREVLRSGETAAIARFRPVSNDNVKLWSLSVMNDQLIMQALLHPDDIAEFDPLDLAPASDEVQELVNQFVESKSTVFDPQTWHNPIRVEANKLDAELADTGVTVAAAGTTPNEGGDSGLIAALAASVAAVKPKKAAAKKAPTKKAAPAKKITAAKKAAPRKRAAA